MVSPKMLKVLINAYAISPDRGSEPGMGWNWCVRLAKECELFIITEGEFRDEIERVLPALPQAANMHFHYLPVSDRVRRMCWNQGDWRFYFHYRLWQKRALALAREICQAERIDIIHQLNMVGFREPGLLWKISGIPYLWGPIGGMALTPVHYFREAPLSERIQIHFKNLFNRIQRKYSPGVIQAIRHSKVVICATRDDYDLVSRYHRAKAELINETGTSVVSTPIQRNHSPLHIIWVGKFMHRKQLGLALKAFSALSRQDVVLDIVGSGTDDEVKQYHALAEKLNVSSQINWHGQVNHDEVGVLMDSADIFFFTSVSEATSTVAMEAISHGLPVVCFDTCGFGPLVEHEMGIKIPLGTPEESAGLFASAIRKLVDDPALRTRMSHACYRKSPELSWDFKIRKVLSLYREITKA